MVSTEHIFVPIHFIVDSNGRVPTNYKKNVENETKYSWYENIFEYDFCWPLKFVLDFDSSSAHSLFDHHENHI